MAEAGIAETAANAAVATALPAISPAELVAWIGTARRGESRVYFRGHLQVARSPRNVRREERQRAAALGTAACEAERRGLVHLLQRRHDADDYSYLIIRTGVAVP